MSEPMSHEKSGMKEGAIDRAGSTCPNCWQPIDLAGASFCPSCGVGVDGWPAPPGNYASGGALPGNVIALHSETITIGRAADNDVQLAHPAVSQYHARLEWRSADQTWVVVDESSARGTFVNYHKVPQDAQGVPIDPHTDLLWIAPYAFHLNGNGRASASTFSPAHLQLDAVDLVRTVKHEKTGKTVPILNLESSPLSFRPGEFIALVGGSGAGKSTLMKAMLGLAPAQQGTVFVSRRPLIQDGHARPFAAMQAIVGYVPQDDVVHHELTPLEALDYVARLRLAPDLDKSERRRYVEESLQTVDLWPHRNKPIRKLSGGQRKRVNIALELLARPRLLFLDEPTSGLDPGLDLSIMTLLRDWAADPADPRTIVLVTHATENVTKCKYVAFMAAGGYVVYFGPPQAALRYFGVERFADIYQYVGNFQPPELNRAAQQEGQAPAPDVRELVQRFSASADHFQYVQSRRLTAAQSTWAEPLQAPATRSIGPRAAFREQFSRQMALLTARYWKLMRRDRLNFAILLLQGLLVAGLLWAVASPDTFQPRGADNAQTVLFIMACAAAWLGILNATKEIVKEQDIYTRERRYGLGAAAYVLSRLLVLAGIGALQMATLLLLLSQHIAIPAGGVLAPWLPASLELFVTLELTLLAGLALGLFVSAATRTVDAATAIMFVLLLLQVMFAGLFFSGASWSDVISLLTFSRWGLEGAGISVNLNNLLRQSIGSAYQADPAYTFSRIGLLGRWTILGGYALLLSCATILLQARKGKS